MIIQETFDIDGRKIIQFSSDSRHYLIDRKTGKKRVQFAIFEKDLQEIDLMESDETVKERELPPPEDIEEDQGEI